MHAVDIKANFYDNKHPPPPKKKNRIMKNLDTS